MITNSTFRCLLVIILICNISSQSILGSSQNKISNNSNSIPCDWQHDNVFFYSHGYSKDLRINNKSSLSTCFVNNLDLYIYYQMPLWPLFPGFKVWNNTGLIADFIIDFCSFDATNFTGIILHRISWLGNFFYVFGYCNDFKITTGYG